MKKLVTKILTVAMLSTALMSFSPKQEAKAGILFLPAGIGIYFIYIGSLYNHLGYFLLDADDQNVIKASLEEKYGDLTDNDLVFENLSQTIENKVPYSEMNDEDKIEVKLTAEEINAALGPEVLNIDLKEALEADLM
ncbi:hypothetical protein N9N67_05115 [Bacteriovoracaceae bacterium]|nr:hypothetical protein [Bacteriovoracaceae bacterium]